MADDIAVNSAALVSSPPAASDCADSEIRDLSWVVVVAVAAAIEVSTVGVVVVAVAIVGVVVVGVVVGEVAVVGVVAPVVVGVGVAELRRSTTSAPSTLVSTFTTSNLSVLELAECITFPAPTLFVARATAAISLTAASTVTSELTFPFFFFSLFYFFFFSAFPTDLLSVPSHPAVSLTVSRQ